MQLFPFVEYWPLYLGFTGFVLALLLLDLGVFHRKAHEVSVKEAGIWTAVWIGIALLFNGGFYLYAHQKFGAALGKQVGLEFLTGYVVEKTLAIDNIFVFAMVFSYFAVPKILQHRILFYGILGALVFRALFIALGSFLMAYHAVVVFFGALLMLTGIKMLFTPSSGASLDQNFLVRSLRKGFRVSADFDEGKFFVKKSGLLYVTPLFLALMFIELSDIIFAVDSVPAIFAITKEPLIVFTSNIFAILGLRSMYFMLGGVMDRFSLIKYGLASVLVFVGLKMVYLNQLFDGKFPIVWSLLVIATLIGGSILVSLWIAPKKTNQKCSLQNYA